MLHSQLERHRLPRAFARAKNRLRLPRRLFLNGAIISLIAGLFLFADHLRTRPSLQSFQQAAMRRLEAAL